MRFILKFLSICSVFSLFLVPAYAFMEEDSGLTLKNARPSFFQAQTNVLIPDREENPQIAISRCRLVTYLTNRYGDQPKDALIHEAVAEIIHTLRVNHSLTWPVYQATYDFYNLLSQSTENTAQIMAWAAKFIKPGMNDQTIMHIVGLIYEYLDDNSTEDRLLTTEELSNPQHPLSALVQNSQQWAETGEAYSKKLLDALTEAVKGWKIL